MILAIYVDDINLLGTPTACHYAINDLQSRFDIELLGRSALCLGLYISHLSDGAMFLHQMAYTQRILKRFHMEHVNSLAIPMMERSCTLQDPYTPACKEEEEMDKPKYLVAVGALLYFATFTRPDISFAMSVLARHSQKPTARHWARIKHLFRYFKGTKDVGLLYSKQENATFERYADARYKSNPKFGKSQIGYIFLKARAPVSWKLVKQTAPATSTNHSELLAFHKATRELIWLRMMDRIISEQAGLELSHKPTILHEDNSKCISRKNVFYDNFVSFWTRHSKHLHQFGRVIPNIHVTLAISCHFGQCHKRPYFLLMVCEPSQRWFRQSGSNQAC